MPFELSAALVVFLALMVWRAAHRRRVSNHGPLPDVGEAPPSADPAFVWRYIDDGLYSRYLTAVPPRGTGDRETD
jgi:hypothetical protein